MRIRHVNPESDWLLRIVTEDGRTGTFDVKPYLELPVFQPLKDESEFHRVHSGGYFVEWACGADLSADTIEAHLVQNDVDAADQDSAVAEKPAKGRY
jgi:hypothetical protein